MLSIHILTYITHSVSRDIMYACINIAKSEVEFYLN